MSYREDLKRALGAPLLDVELDEKVDLNDNSIRDDYDFIELQVLRVVRTYLPCEYIMRKVVPAGGNGAIDLSNEDILTVKEVWVIRNRTDSGDVLLPWSLVRIWEKIWVGASEFVGTDLLLYKNELAMLAKASDNVFSWKWYEAERKLYVSSVPSWGVGIGILALKGVNKLDDICFRSFEYGMALKLAVALAKQKIGQTFRKYSVEGMTMPGGDMVTEGKEEEKEAIAKIEENRYYVGGLS